MSRGFHARARAIAVAALLVSGVALTASPPAHAADDGRTLPAERLEPGLDSEAVGNTVWAGVPEHLSFDLGLGIGYENDPIFAVDAAGVRGGSFVQNRLTADVTANIALFDWLELGADLPMALAQLRDEALAPAVDRGTGALSTGLGDVTLLPKVRLLRQRDGLPLDLAFFLPLQLPTSFGTDYFGGAGASVAPSLAASHTWGPLRGAANLGLRVRETERARDVTTGNELVYKLGLAYVFDVVPERPTEVSLSLSGASSALPFRGGAAGPSPLELLFDLQHKVWGSIDVLVGGGSALTAGLGVPDFRLFGGLRFSERPPVDRGCPP